MTPAQRALAVLPPGAEPTAAYLRRAWAWLMERTEYRYDSDNPQVGSVLEHWRTLLPQMIRAAEAGDTAAEHLDDCDGFACTIADIALLVGIRPDRVRVVRCWAGPFDPGQGYNHAVADVLDDAGDWWRFDIYAMPPDHTPYIRGAFGELDHRDVDYQTMPFRPGAWAPMAPAT